MHPPEVVEAFFHRAGARAERARERDRVELVALDRSAGEEPAVRRVDAVDLALDHAAHRLRQLALDRRHRPRQMEPTLVALDHRAIAQVAQKLGEKERIALGSRVEEPGQEGWEVVVREERVDVRRDRHRVEQADRDLATEATALELALDVQKRMLAEQ